MRKKYAALPARMTAVRVRQLQLFTVLADVGSISEAARQSNVTQPSATEMLKELERAFSMQLFLRGPRGISLTPQGERVAARAALALRELQWALDEANLVKERHETLRLGFVPMAVHTGLPQALAAFLAQQPHLHLSLRELNVPDVTLALSRGEIDAAVTLNHPSFGGLDGEEHFAVSPLAEEELCAYASVGLPLPAGEISAEELRQLPWILPATELHMRRTLDEWFLQQGLSPPEAIAEVTPMMRAAEMMRGIQAVALLPIEMRAHAGGQGHLRRIHNSSLQFSIRLVMVCRQSYFERPTIQKLLRCLQEPAAPAA